MHAPRNRARVARLLGSNHNRKTRWRVDYCALVGGILLLGSVALVYDAIVGQLSSRERQQLDVGRKKPFQAHGNGDVAREEGAHGGGDVAREEGGDLSTGVFSSDDEPVDEETRIRVEKMLDIEDVLLLRVPSQNKESWGRVQDGQSSKKERRGGAKEASDPLNPQNNPMLQDLDATGGGLTKTDWALLKALSKTNAEPHKDFDKKAGNLKGDKHANAQPKSLLRDNQVAKTDNQVAKTGNQVAKTGTVFEVGPRKVKSKRSKPRVRKLNLDGLWIKWGDFPGLDPQLSFSGFMAEFLVDEKCPIKFFMAWMTPPWSFTVRHQRVLESLLHFHPNACVVVFSETVELQFFKSFVEEGYRVAVVMPSLRELLESTPTAAFANIWYQWRIVDLFYLHYTELLRLNALYRYGGIYLDWDMIILKPLTGLRNTIGVEELANGQLRPNGAIMVFEKLSPFLYKSMEEFTATYIETIRDWNGAGLLDRVMNASLDNNDDKLAISYKPHVEPPMSFFPITSTSIYSYFKAPEDEEEILEQKEMSDRILSESFTVHLWNELTYNLIPEPGSLVETLLDRSCIHCTDIL